TGEREQPDLFRNDRNGPASGRRGRRKGADRRPRPARSEVGGGGSTVPRAGVPRRRPARLRRHLAQAPPPPRQSPPRRPPLSAPLALDRGSMGWQKAAGTRGMGQGVR